MLAIVHTPTAVLWQDGPLRWIHLHVSPARVLAPYYEAVQMLREESRKYFGAEPKDIIVPFTQQHISWLFQNCDSWAIAFAQYPGEIKNHYSNNKLLQFANTHSFIFPKIIKTAPLANALNIFTDGSSNGTAVYIIEGNKPYVLKTPSASAQIVELRAVAAVFAAVLNAAFNLYTDSQYTAKALPILESVSYIHTANSVIQALLAQIQLALHNRTHPCYIGHIRAHSGLPSPLTKNNALVDKATQVCALSQVEQAQNSHAIHHQNSQHLRKQFKLTREAARQIVRGCPVCPQYFSVPSFRVNPRGLKPNQLWQMDVTHVPEFRKQKYVRVCIDTFSGYLLAAAQTREATKHVISHCLKCFTAIGHPENLKTDNGSGYTSQAFQRFWTIWHCP